MHQLAEINNVECHLILKTFYQVFLITGSIVITPKFKGIHQGS